MPSLHLCVFVAAHLVAWELAGVSVVEDRVAALQNAGAAALFGDARRGVEKECLRVTPEGYIAATSHPERLGSALTHRFITTDFSEALLEFVTPPLDSTWEVIQFLCDLHQFAGDALDDELLWAMSMPCMIRSDDDIPLARYGSSNVAQMKTIYRRGLGYRYGRYMQAISGIHYNYSLPDGVWPLLRELLESRDGIAGFRSEMYFGLVRNVRRLDWLLLYLFGASPAVCKSFLRDLDVGLEEFDRGTFYGPFATSLRMSDLGYQNKNQASLRVSANNLEEYVRDLDGAIRTPNDDYAALGLIVDGEYRQLSTNLLQIENEYYSTIRPKRVANSGERPTAALTRAGVEYVELRALDVSPFDPIGINRRTAGFLEIFLVYCLLTESPPAGPDEYQHNAANHLDVARRGREPGLALRRSGGGVALADWGAELLDGMQAVAELMDPDGDRGYRDALRVQRAAVENPGLTPSARLLDDLRQTGLPLFTYAMDLSRRYRDYFASLDAGDNPRLDMLRAESEESLARQRRIETEDRLSFDEYLAAYYR